MSRSLLYAVVGGGALVIAGAWYVLFHSPRTPLSFEAGGSPSASVDGASEPDPSKEGEADRITGPLKDARSAPAGSTAYRNDTYRFQLFYPASLSIQSYDEGKGASTITFQNVAEAKGFQIFIVPYGEHHVTNERFLKDEPSGEMKGQL